MYYSFFYTLEPNMDQYDHRLFFKKSRIRETKNLWTDADSSTDAIGGWAKAKSATTKKTFFFFARRF